MNVDSGIIKLLLEQGVSLIPVGEKDKVPKVKWQGQKKLSEHDLMFLIQKYDTYAVAMVLGKPSGGVVCLDVDVKWKTGFGGVILSDLKDLYGDGLWERLVIDKTPSGGYHILYRVEGIEDGCSKLASRESTEEELLANPKEKAKCFLEVKANGGLSQCFPSPGYSRVKGEKIQELTLEEHRTLIAFGASYNEVYERQKTDKKTEQRINDYYSENPFDMFDKSIDGSLILEDYGWKELRKSGKYIYYTKPDGKKKEVGASWNKEKKLYKIFTTSTELDTKAYSPSNLLAALKYGGDKKQLYSYLVAKGFGRIKPDVERSIVKQKARYGGELPANISEEGIKEYTEEKERFGGKYPFGIFWDVNEDGVVSISQKDVDRILIEKGYRWYEGEIYLIKDWKLCRKSEGEMFHDLLMYIGDDENKEIYNCYSRFIDRFAKLTIRRIIEFGKVDEDKLLLSGKHESFKFYTNCYVSVKKDGFLCVEYKDIGDKLVFENMILDREYKEVSIDVVKKSKYWEYLDKSIGMSTRLLKTIGYLTHDYLDDSMNAIIVGSETCEDPKRGGGSGKNLFFNILNHMSSVHVISGRQAELDKNLLQAYNFERILVISDVDEKFDISFFKDFSSGAASLKKLYKDVVVLKRRRMPKPVILTNYSYDLAPGLERRVIDLEFTEFFSRIRGGVGKHFGCMFPGFEDKGDWTVTDWECFDNIVLEGIRLFLEAGELTPISLSDSGWAKQFNQNYRHLHDFIRINIDKWTELWQVANKNFQDEYNEYCKSNHCKGYTSHTVNKALKEYCEHYKIDFEYDNVVWRDGTSTVRGRRFGSKKIESKEDVPF